MVFHPLFILYVLLKCQDFSRVSCSLPLIPCFGYLNIRECITKAIEYGHWACEEISDVAIKLAPYPLNLPLTGKTDVSWLEDNLYCLIGNAVKYSLSSGDGVLVTVKYDIIISEDHTADADDISVASSQQCKSQNSSSSYASSIHPDTPGLLIISIQDSGTDLSEDSLLKFFRCPLSHERGQVGGLGLGLYCLKQRVNTLGGSCGVRLRSDGNSGTVVWMKVPLMNPSTPYHSDMLPRGIFNKSPSINDVSSRKSTPRITSLSFMEPTHSHSDRLRRQTMLNPSTAYQISSFCTTAACSYNVSGSNTPRSDCDTIDTSEIKTSTEMKSFLPVDSTTLVLSSAVIDSPLMVPFDRLLPDESSYCVDEEVEQELKVSSISLLKMNNLTTTAASRGSFNDTDNYKTIQENNENLSHILENQQNILTTDDDHPNKGKIYNGSIFNGLSILVVDDSIPILKMLVKVLKQAGAIVTEAKNGKEAFDKFVNAKGEFDVVVTDIQVNWFNYILSCVYTYVLC